MQLASLTLNGNFVNSTMPSFIPPSFSPPRFSVAINTLWSLSLVVALITASIGILVKQWFHEYMARDTQDPQEQLQIKLYRDVGMDKWRVFEIAAFLPLLLQLALLLFFVGLGLFLYELNAVVGWITTGVMIFWLVFFLFATFIPVVSAQCPYKTPMLKTPFRRLRSTLQTAIVYMIQKLSNVLQSCFRHYQPVLEKLRNAYERLEQWDKNVKSLEEDQVRKDTLLRFSALSCVRDILQGEKLNDTILQSVQEIGAVPIIQGFAHFIRKQQAGDQSLQSRVPIPPGDCRHWAREAFGVLFGRDHSLPKHLSWGNWTGSLRFASRYIALTFALSKSYIPGPYSPIPSTSLPAFVRLIQDGPTSAAFTILTMYSVRQRTISEHPSKWDHLFSPTEKQPYDTGKVPHHR